MGTITYKSGVDLPLDQALALYNDAGWTIYTASEETLQSALENSLMVLSAWKEDKLIGLVRVVGDASTIIYIQDILVLKGFQRKGIGRKLISRVLEKYAHVRQIVLLTDNTEKTIRFYQSTGFARVDDLNLTSFIRIKQVSALQTKNASQSL